MIDVDPATLVRRSYTWVFWVVLVVAVLAGGYWLVFKRDPLPAEIRIAAGAKGGLYHKVAEEMAVRMQDKAGRSVRVLETKGTVENKELLLNGEADLAVFQAGAAPMDGLAGLAPLYPDMVFVLARKGSGITSVHQLSGKAVSIGPEGSGMRSLALDILGHFGINPATLRKSELYF